MLDAFSCSTSLRAFRLCQVESKEFWLVLIRKFGRGRKNGKISC